MTLEGRSAALEALAQGRGAVVWQRQIADVETPVSAALKLIEPGRGDWVLESVESGETRGRYSLIGLDPDLMFEVTGDAARINREWRHDRTAFAPSRAGAPGTARPRRRMPLRGAGGTAQGAGDARRLLRL